MDFFYFRKENLVQKPACNGIEVIATLKILIALIISGEGPEGEVRYNISSKLKKLLAHVKSVTPFRELSRSLARERRRVEHNKVGLR